MLISDNLIISPDSNYAKEIVKHEAHFTKYGPPGRPYEFRPYPTMLYKASRPKQGGAEPNFEHVEAADDRERERYERNGFVWGGKAAALEALERQEFEIAELAANRADNDRKMSEKARTEADALDSATVQHLAAIPEAHPKTGRRS